MTETLATTENSPGLISTKPQRRLGGLGHLGVFCWGLVLLLAFSGWASLWLMLATLAVSVWLYPASLRQIFRPRILILVLIFAVTVYAFSNATDELACWLLVAQMTLRALGLMVLVNGVASALEITEIASLFECIGLKGLGFSLGVAFNLLPALSESAQNAWRSLTMRGGLRHQRGRALQLLLVTVISNALRRAEEIALAAEARAFDPQRARNLAISHGRYDWLPWLGGLVIFIFGRLAS